MAEKLVDGGKANWRREGQREAARQFIRFEVLGAGKLLVCG
jgi:hypothetical protein